ncbi:MAG: aminotransferase class I/II-fold pyridoxal phosphate-dependent enzyme [Acidobacteriota bacterium]|nr:aminotransferase class I/II-fold pyridoxal phosphate-dependent enzyme [Acidobacteriota bacterium]
MSLPSHHSNGHQGLAPSCSSGTLFNGFFSNGNKWTPVKKGLLDSRARSVFDLMGRACEADMYPYQAALESRSGPRVQLEGRNMLMLSSYDYLGLIGHPDVDAAAIQAIRKYGTGTGGVRMLTGTNVLHHEMERELADFKGMPEAITFSSGYLANLAILSALLTPADKVILDSLSHRSLVDACHLAGVPLLRFRHNDPDSLEQQLNTAPFGRRTLIIADGVYSMDGDICPLPDLIALKKKHNCFLMIDESHSFGVLGATGRGVDEHFGCATQDVDLWTGSLAKAIPSNGGYAAVSQDVAIYLQHAAAPFIFSAALCPAAVGAVRASISILQAEPERVTRLRQNAEFMRNGLRDAGYDIGLSATPVIPVILRDEPTAAAFARSLRDRDILVTPVLFPAVPHGTARLRLCVTAEHSRQDLEYALTAFRQLQT